MKAETRGSLVSKITGLSFENLRSTTSPKKGPYREFFPGNFLYCLRQAVL